MFLAIIFVSSLYFIDNVNTLTPIYIKGFKEFSAKLSTVEEELSESQLVGNFPFGVGLILTQLNTQIWKINTTGFSEALGVPKNEISKAYNEITTYLKNDPHTKISSTLFTSKLMTSVPLALKNLQTEIKTIDFQPSHQLSPNTIMNAHISENTFGKIKDTPLVPTETLAGPPFGKFTRGVFINTFYYKNQWDKKLRLLGNKEFDGGSIPFVEYTGPAKVIHDANFVAVSIPLKGGQKSLVLAMPKDVTKILDSYEKLNFESLTVVPLRIQFPLLNQNLPGLFYHWWLRRKFGVRNTFCNINSQPEHFAERIGQQTFVGLNNEGITLSIATGNAISNWKDWRDTFQGVDGSSRRKRNAFYRHGNRNTPKNTSSEIKFNRPFIWALYDKQLGPIFSSVLTMSRLGKSEKEVVVEGFEWLLQMHIQARWSCGDGD